jgi:hypothetical protein
MNHCGLCPKSISWVEADVLYITARCLVRWLMTFWNYIMGISTYYYLVW